MVIDPMPYIDTFGRQVRMRFLFISNLSDAGEALKRIRGAGKRAGITINPGTEAAVIFDLLDREAADEILVMSVEPGFGGQSYIPAEPKIAALRQRYPHMDISVDGGIDAQTVWGSGTWSEFNCGGFLSI